MPGIRNTLSYSITAPSRLKPSPTPTFTAQSPSYVPPTKIKSNEPLPNQIFKGFTRKPYIKQNSLSPSYLDQNDKKKQTLSITVSPPSNLTKRINEKMKEEKERETTKLSTLKQSQDLNGRRETASMNEISSNDMTSTNLDNKARGHSVISTSSTSSDENVPIPAGDVNNNIQKRGSINMAGSGDENAASSFSSMRHWLSAKRSTLFSVEYMTNLEPFTEQNENDSNSSKNVTPYLHPMDNNNNNNNNNNIGNNMNTRSRNNSPYVNNVDIDRDRGKSSSVSMGIITNLFDNIIGLNNLPSPNVLRRISKSPNPPHSSMKMNNDEMDKLDLSDSAHNYNNNNNNNGHNSNYMIQSTRISSPSVFAPPLTQKMLDMQIARPSLFTRHDRNKSILKDPNLINDVGDNFCALCQNMYNEDETLIVLSCGHEFHETCGKEWFQYKSVCPICRKKCV